MPQTLEHLAVLEHLGVAAGIPVRHQGRPGGARLARAGAARRWRERLAGSPVAFEPPVAISARTGQRPRRARARLAARAATLATVPPPISSDCRWIGRSRSPAWGPWSPARPGPGASRSATRSCCCPSGRPGRVRSIESYGQTPERSEPGARTAVGLAGVAARRGAAGARGSWRPMRRGSPAGPSMRRSALQPDAPRALVSRSRVRVHLGTAEVMARVHPRAPIEPGGTGLARLSLEQPVVARGGRPAGAPELQSR